MSFGSWLVFALFGALVIGELVKELKKKNWKQLDWQWIGLLLLIAWILYRIQFG